MNKQLTDIFAKTKILCTLGPASNSKEMISRLILSGVDGVRLNFSHGNYEFYGELFKNINAACSDENTPLAVLMDLQGPKIRVGELETPEIELTTGQTVEITTDDVIGTKKKISTSYKPLAEDAKVGDAILMDDGLIRLRIIEKHKISVKCFIENGGQLKPRKGMNLPGMRLSTPSVTEKDFRDLEFALNYRVDYIALSFVRSAADMTNLREWLRQRNFIKPIIAKIEKKEAVDSFDEILKVSDGIMVARGDLGVELPPHEVPSIQKQIITKCNAYGKLVITATQMLESMINNPISTRAEASDVANAVWDGTDVVMLSGETSIGKFPVQTVKTMNDIVKDAELHNRTCQQVEFPFPKEMEENLFDSVGRGIFSMSKQINAAAVVVFTFKGRTAVNIAKFRPHAKIIAFTNSSETMNELCLRWGVTSIFMDEINKEHIAIENAKKLLLESGNVKEGDVVLFAAGAPYSERSRANWLRFEVI